MGRMTPAKFLQIYSVCPSFPVGQRYIPFSVILWLRLSSLGSLSHECISHFKSNSFFSCYSCICLQTCTKGRNTSNMAHTMLWYPSCLYISAKPSYLWSRRVRYWWYENVCVVTLGVRSAFQHTERLHYHYILSLVLFNFFFCFHSRCKITVA